MSVVLTLYSLFYFVSVIVAHRWKSNVLPESALSVPVWVSGIELRLSDSAESILPAELSFWPSPISGLF